jgi:REP element-mobilizing transposase RayT
MANSKPTPRNANLPIGELNRATQQSTATPQRNTAPTAAWHSRGYLPHFESSEVTQHVTFHLADSLPQSVLQRLNAQLKTLPTGKRDVELRKRVDAWIDAGHGSCILRQPIIAAMVQRSLLTFDSQRYRLLAWAVMPNHVHVLFQPIVPWKVQEIVAAWKKFTARKIHDHRPEIGTAPVWHREYWDRYIRDQSHFAQAIDYIHMNPVKAGLVTKPENWRWSSAFPGNANLPIGVFEFQNPANQEIGVPGAKP